MTDVDGPNTRLDEERIATLSGLPPAPAAQCPNTRLDEERIATELSKNEGEELFASEYPPR